ncbi:MAG TPA: glutamyl-tRNA reductase, partial [Polyangiaceae bacterium]|nr:glutamyl-tRNA reductase [Polyangiaceae bacterium]
MIVVVGLSHRTAPIAVREKLVLDAAGLPDFLRALVQRPEVGEALLVSTCNRVELVAAGRAGFDSDLGQVAKACVDALAAHSPGIAPHLYAHVGGSAVRHLFRVAASLDSMVLGEPQILGQVKEAYEVARKAGTVGSVLHRTLPRAIRAAKRVRTETAIGSGQVSVPSVAVDLTRQIFGDLSGHCALLVGSGEMAEAVARLLKVGGASVIVVGRTLSRAEELANAVGGSARPWTALQQSLAEADVVVTSTSAPHFVVDYEMVSAARRARRG